MRWPVKEKAEHPPRWVRRFAWFPVEIGQQTVWLETYEQKQHWLVLTQQWVWGAETRLPPTPEPKPNDLSRYLASDHEHVWAHLPEAPGSRVGWYCVVSGCNREVSSYTQDPPMPPGKLYGWDK